MAKADKEQLAKEAAERARVEQQRREGAAALDQEKANEAAKSDEQRAAEAAEAQAQTEAAQKEEAERAAAEQQAAEEELARIGAEAAAQAEAERLASEQNNSGDSQDDELSRQLFVLSPDARLLKAGTIVHLNGEECVLPVDVPIVMKHGADEQHFASVLARESDNFALNSDRLRLVYNPMNGTPLPLGSQRLKLEEMTEQERAVFAVPPMRPKK